MTTIKAVDVINSTLTPSSQISASLVSEKNISASITTGVVINQIENGGTPGITSPGGANTQVQFNDDGTLGGASTVTYNKVTGTLTGTTINATIVNATFAGNGANVTGLNYNNITNKPVLADVATSGDYDDLSNTPVLATVATSGDYDDLSNTPVLATVATSGAYADLSGKPTLAPVATSGLYSDLTGKPVLGTAALVDSTVFATAAQGAKADTAIQTITSTDGSVAVTTTGTARNLSVVYANQSRTLISTCRNNSGTPMTTGTVVYISTAQGSQPVITRAQANTESTSTKTYGVVQGTIADNGSGTVVVAGQLNNVNTLGLTTGATLWLSPTVAGGFTITKPSAPDHAVVVGTVVYAHQNNGIIEVRVVNGYELEELHNVSLNGTTNGQVLTYDSATSLWKAATPKSALSQFTNDSGFITSSAVASGYQVKDADLTAISALSGTGFAKRTGVDTWTLDTSTYLTAITSGQVVSALGYTPYDASNPDAYVTAAATVARALVADSVLWTNVSGRPTALSQFSNDSNYATVAYSNSNYQIKAPQLTAVTALATAGYVKRVSNFSWTASSTIPWTDISSKPTFATVATSGLYSDLSGKPTALSSFTNDSGFITTTAANTAYQPKDADLTILSSLSDNGFVKRSGGQYVIDSTSVYLTGITSTQVTTALGYTPINPTQKGAINGIASLDGTGQVPLTQLPDSLENVITVASYSFLPVTGVENKIYIVDDTNLIYRWDTNAYKAVTTSVANSDAVPEGVTNKYFTIARARDSINVSGDLTYDSVNGTVGYVAPTLATVATTGNYADLVGEPTLLSQFTNDSGFITTTAANTNYQAKDADLTSIAGLAGTTGILKKTAANTWALDTTAYLSTATAATTYQPLDGDLTSIAGLAGTTGNLKKTGANTWVLDTTVYLPSATAATTYQPVDTDLTAIAALNGAVGLLKKTGTGTWTIDTSTYLTSAILSGYQPLSADLTAIDSLSGTTGILKKTAADTWTLDTTGFQPLDADLTSIAGLAGTTGSLIKTAANTWALDTTAYLPTATAATTYQPLDGDLTAIAALNGAVGLLKKTATNTWTIDTATYQVADADLTAIAALAGTTGILKKTAANTWALDTTAYLPTATAATTYQPVDADLTAIGALTGTTGILKKTAANTWALDTTAYQAVDADLSAIASLTTNGFAKRTGTGAWAIDSSTYQPLDADLTSIAGLTGLNGLLRKNNTNTWVLDTNTYITQFDRAAAAGELNQGTQLNGNVGAGNGGAVRVTMNTVAQTGSIDVNVAPVTPDGEALIFTKAISITADGIMPGADPSSGNLGRDLGSATARWRSIYLNDYYGSATEPSINFGSEFGATGFYGTGNGAYIYTTMGGVDSYITTPDYISPVLAQSGLKSLGHPSLRWRKVVLAAGTEAVPAVVIGSAGTNTGLYAEVDGTISFTNAGVKTAAISSTGLTVVGAVNGAKFKAGLGSVTDVSYKLSSNGTSTGLYSEIEGEVSFAAAGIKTGAIDSVGNLTMVGSVTAYSDSRLKEDLNVITSALDKVKELTGYTYTRKDNGEKQTGLIAQDVQKVLPEAVVQGPEYLSVAYGNLMGLIVESIKELNTKIDKLGASK